MKFCLEKLKGKNCLEDIKCVKKYDTTMYRKEVGKKVERCGLDLSG